MHSNAKKALVESDELVKSVELEKLLELVELKK